MPDDDGVVLGPPKEVLNDAEKVQVQPEQRPETPTVQPVSPRRRFLSGLSVSQLISLYNDDAATSGWNEETRAEILELILEKGGPGAVRRALGRAMAVADGHIEATRRGQGPAGDDPAPLGRPTPPEPWWEPSLLRSLGAPFLRAALATRVLEALGAGATPPDLPSVLRDLQSELLAAVAAAALAATPSATEQGP